jgi:hypothetical protein
MEAYKQKTRDTSTPFGRALAGIMQGEGMGDVLLSMIPKEVDVIDAEKRKQFFSRIKPQDLEDLMVYQRSSEDQATRVAAARNIGGDMVMTLEDVKNVLTIEKGSITDPKILADLKKKGITGISEIAKELNITSLSNPEDYKRVLAYKLALDAEGYTKSRKDYTESGLKWAAPVLDTKLRVKAAKDVGKTIEAAKSKMESYQRTHQRGIFDTITAESMYKDILYPEDMEEYKLTDLESELIEKNKEVLTAKMKVLPGTALEEFARLRKEGGLPETVLGINTLKALNEALGNPERIEYDKYSYETKDDLQGEQLDNLISDYKKKREEDLVKIYNNPNAPIREKFASQEALRTIRDNADPAVKRTNEMVDKVLDFLKNIKDSLDTIAKKFAAW